MVAKVNSAEGGTNGATVTTANSGGLSGDPWDSVSIPTGTTATFATAALYKGTLGYRMTQGTANGSGANLRRSLVGWTQVRHRFYFRTSALPGSAATIAYVTDGGTGTSVIARLIVRANGKLVVNNAAGDPVFVAAASIAVNTWYRVEWIVVPGTTTSNGTIRFTYAAGDGAAIETYASTTANTGTDGTLGTLYVGKLAGVWDANTDFDDFAADDASATTFLGPSGSGPVVVDPTPPPAPPVAAWPPPPPYTDAIRSSGTKLAYSVSATRDDAPVAGATELSPIGGSIVDTTKPGVRRTLNLELAGGHELFDLLAPTGTELAVSCTVTYNDRTSATFPMGVFDIDSDKLEEGRGRISVTAPDKWVRIQRAKFLQPTSSTPGMAVTAQIAALIRGALGADEPVTITATSSASMGWIVWEKDRDKAITDLCEQIGAWCYFDRFGEATIADIPQAGTAKRTWLVDASAQGVLVELTRERSRTDTYNVVVVSSSSADSELFPTQVVWDSNTLSPTYAGVDPLGNPGSAGPFGIVTAYLDSPNLGSAVEAQAAGLSYLARGAGLASQVSLGQVPNPAVDAFDAINVLPPSEVASDPRILETHVVDTVTHPLLVGDTPQQIDGRQIRIDL